MTWFRKLWARLFCKKYLTLTHPPICITRFGQGFGNPGCVGVGNKGCPLRGDK